MAETSRPPQDYFSVWQRLFRGYGPLALFAALIVVVALVAPSRAPAQTALGSTGAVSAGTVPPVGSSDSAAAGATGAGSTGPATAGATGATGSAGAGTAAGSGGAAGTSAAKAGSTAPAAGAAKATTAPAPATAAGKTSGCAGKQVPGDPYSPPCIAFSGSNGGATSKGVTASSISVTYRVTNDQGFQQTLAQLAGAQLQDTQADIERTITTLATYFNDHFQLYGRKINVQFFNGQGSLSNELLGQGQAQADADAVTVGQQTKAFADLSAESEPYADALSKQGVMAFGDPYMSQNWHVQHAPYAWSAAVDGTTVADLGASYALAKLCPPGTPAAYAGGSLKGAPRKFASLAPDNSWYQESVQAAGVILQKGGCGTPENVSYQLDLGTESNQAADIVSKLKSDGVTTVLCGCDPIIPVYLSGEAARQSYFPEFIIVGTALTDQDLVGQLWNQQFAAHAFGISPSAPTVPETQGIGYAAFKAVDPKDEPAFDVDLIYQQMDEMAIGLEMAGPDLTPATFQQGMFAYPKQSGPYGLWGFANGDYTTTDDVREICWNPTATSAYNNKQGAYQGTSNARWTISTIPSGPPGCPIPAS